MSSSTEPQPVDFRKPRRMAASARQAVSDWYARSITRTIENLQSHVAEPPQITHAGSEVMLARDALQQLPDAGWGCVLRIGPEVFTTLITFPLKQILLLVNAMIGATGEDWPQERPLSAVEEELARLIINDLACGLADGWPGRMQLAVLPGDVESRPARTRLFAPRTPVYLSTLRISQSQGDMECQWILPEDQLAELVARSAEEAAAHPPTVNHAIMNHLARQMPVDVIVELGAGRPHDVATVPARCRRCARARAVRRRSTHCPSR